MTDKELGREIEGYLNENPKGLIYSFTKQKEQSDGLGRALLVYLVHHEQRHGEITVEFLVSGFKHSGSGGQTYKLNLNQVNAESKLNSTVIGWISQDLKRTEELL